MIKVEYDDFTEEEYETKDDAKHGILEAHAEGVSVTIITDTNDEDIVYSLIWDVTLQREL